MSSAVPDPPPLDAHLERAEIPVLAASAAMIERLRAQEDAREGSVDANLIGEAAARDPLMTLHVLVHAARHRPPRLVTDPQTVTATAVLMGIPPFFRAFGALPAVESRLADRPDALAGLGAALRRSTRAASLAFAFAARRADADAALIHQAALLHDFARLLLWCHAPDVALAVQAEPRAAAPPFDLSALQWQLADAWALPPLLRRPPRERDALLPRARCVALAVQLAHGDATPALQAQVAELLAMPLADAGRFIAEADGDVADGVAAAG